MASIKERVTNFKNEITELIGIIKPQVKIIIKFTIEHYLILTSFFAFLFSIVCYTRTTTYFEEWGINFFDYASLSDLYIVALKADIATIALRITALIAIIIAASILLLNTVFIVITDSNKHDKVTRLAQISMFIAMSMLILSTLLLMPISKGKLIMSPSNIEQFPRVNVGLRWGDSIQCASVIAGVSNYLFVWEFESSKPTAISRTNVTRVEYTIEQQPPFDMLILRDKSGKPTKQRTQTRSPENQNDLDEWKAKLLKVCNQKLSKEDNNDTKLPPQPIKKTGIE